MRCRIGDRLWGCEINAVMRRSESETRPLRKPVCSPPRASRASSNVPPNRRFEIDRARRRTTLAKRSIGVQRRHAKPGRHSDPLAESGCRPSLTTGTIEEQRGENRKAMAAEDCRALRRRVNADGNAPAAEDPRSDFRQANSPKPLSFPRRPNDLGCERGRTVE